MKRILCICLIILTFICFLYRYELKDNFYKTYNREVDVTEDLKYVDDLTHSILKKVDNKTDKDKLIMKEFQLKDLLNFDYENSTIKDINNKFQVECLRKISGYYYSIFKADDGSYTYVMYKLDNDKKTLIVNDYEFMHNTAVKEDFNSIKVGKSTYQDVIMIDPRIESVDSNYSFSSFITLKDGGNIIIDYNREQKNTVSKIKYTPPHPNCVANLILGKDLPKDNIKVWRVKSVCSLILAASVFVFIAGRQLIRWKNKTNGLK